MEVWCWREEDSGKKFLLHPKLSNAIRFVVESQERRVTLTVDLASRPNPEGAPLVFSEEASIDRFDANTPIYLYFKVCDTGPGLKQTEAECLFKYLSQASPLTHTTHSGSGLGLWICRKLAVLMGGAIELDSTFGVGSSFRGVLEISTVEAELMDMKEAAAVAPVAGPPIQPINCPALRVLCCEDNYISRTVLVRQLTKYGHSVEFAEGKASPLLL